MVDADNREAEPLKVCNDYNRYILCHSHNQYTTITMYRITYTVYVSIHGH